MKVTKPTEFANVGHWMKRERFDIARSTLARLMKRVARGNVVQTTVPDTSAPCPCNKVNRLFRVTAPNLLCINGFPYVPTRSCFVQMALNFDTFADCIVGG